MDGHHDLPARQTEINRRLKLSLAGESDCLTPGDESGCAGGVLHVVEDAAQGVMATYKGRALGSIGDLGPYSFYETKNVISGEGGAFLVNDPSLALRAEIIREKGTDRSRFFRGEVDKYAWQEVGSSFLPGELIAAFLWAQLEEADPITKERLASWQRYHELLEPIEAKGILRRPIVPDECQHNAHMYYVVLAPEIDRQKVHCHRSRFA